MRLGKRRLFGLGILGLVASCLLLIALTTSALRLVLKQIPGLEPAEGLSGRMIGPIAADSLRWSQNGLQIEIEGLQLDHAPLRLLGGRIALSELRARRLRLTLAPPSEEQTPASGPIKLDLPAIELPFDIVAAKLRIEQLEVCDHLGESLLDADLSAQELSLLGAALQIQGLVINDQRRGRLQLDGRLDSSQDWAGELQLGADLQAPLNSRLSLRSSGNLRELTVQLNSEGGILADLQAQLSDLRTIPRWDLRMAVDRTDQAELSSLPPGELRLQLQGQGSVEQLELHGELRAAGYQLKLQPLRAQFNDNSIALGGSAIEVLGQISALLQLDGRWPLDSSAAAGDLSLSWEQMVVAGAEPELRSARGSIGLSGFSDAYQFELQAALLRGDLSGELTAGGEGGSEALSEFILALDSSAGQLLASGSVVFQPLQAQLHTEARQLQPQLLAADWPGLLNLDAELHIAQEAELLNASAKISRLHGRLRDAPLSGEGQLDWVAQAWPTGKLRIQWGGNELTYQRDVQAHGQLNVDARALGLAVPELQGRVQIDLRVPERLDDLAELTGSADAAGLRLPGLEIDSFNVSRSGGSATPITLRGRGLRASQLNLQELALLAAPGAGADWRMDLRATGPELTLAVETELAPAEGGWAGRLHQLDAKQQTWPAITLAQPAEWRWSDGNLGLQRSCLTVDQAPAESGTLCVAVQSSRAEDPGLQERPELRVQIDLAQLSLQPLNRLATDMKAELEGLLDGEIEIIAGAAGTPRITGSMQVPALLLSLPGPDDERLTRELAVVIEARPEDALQSVELTLSSALGGALRASALGDLGAEVPDWAFKLNAQDLDLRLIEGLSPELVSPRGTLAGDLGLQWRDQQWVPVGELQLLALSGELPSAGISFAALDLQLGASADGQLSLSGGGLLGEGRFEIDGSYPLDPQAEARLRVKGSNLLLADLPIVRLQASPDLQILRRGKDVKIKGQVDVPSAIIDLARFEPEVKASPDVVVIDDPESERAQRLNLTADVKLSIGEDVKLKGFGLDGNLRGALSVRERPGKLTTGRGELDVTGSYRAYGQDLTIKRGKLLFSGGPVANPGLDILAVRKIEGVEAGVRVRGAADNPELALYSNPPMDQADALSYLVLGKVLNTASGGDNQALGAAASALGSVGGSLLASKLGAGTGLEVSMESSADLGGAALTVGRFLNPKLYFGIGQSIFEPISVAILRFRLSDRWELEGLSGRELKAGVNYRHEK